MRIVVKARKGRKQYMFFLCLLELVEKNSKNYQLVHDYNLWFSNL
ncbi:calcium-binding protein [Desulfitobacterium sp.]